MSTHLRHTVGDPKNVMWRTNLMAFLAILAPSITKSARGGKVQGEGGLIGAF